jgi:hypothetical protein
MQAITDPMVRAFYLTDPLDLQVLLADDVAIRRKKVRRI